MSKNHKRKTLALGIILLFIVGLFVPCSQSSFKQIQKNPSVNREQIDKSTESGTITCYAFGKTGNEKQGIVLSSDEVTLLFERLKELNSEMTRNPYTEKTQSLKIAFVDLLDEKGLLPNGVSKETYLSLLNPKWVEQQQTKEKRSISSQPFANRGTCVFCSMGGEGSGILMPLFLLPRPRFAMFWLGDGLSTAANMLTSKGYAAGGVQTGFAFGFMGIGLSYSLPGYSMYGFIGYALLATTAAEYVEHYPPNSVPEISDITPADGQQNVPVILSELQFRIQDADGDLMSYSVTTDPDIGSRSGNLKPFGVYTVPISGLKVNSMYKWTVEVTDGKDTTIQEFSFETPVAPFNPFDEGWQYRKQISINHSQVAGDLSNFPIFIHSIDADLSAKAQPGGDDILFMDGIGVAYKLFHEIESYKASNGELLAWVNIPNLNADENTTIYMYYGNPESGNAQMPERVWDPYFAVVWHLKESSGEIHDSTNRVSGGTIDGAQLVSGKMGSALEFLDHDSVKGISSSFDDSITDAFTVTAWVKWYGPCTYPHDQIIFDGRSSLTNGFVFFIQHDTGLLKMYLMRANTVIYSESPIPVGVWTFVVGVFNDDTNTMRLYINGVENGAITTTEQYLDSSESAMIGNNHWASSDGQWAPTNGVIDELRIVQTERTADWLVTEYNNQNDPFDFLTFGSEEGQP